ncbi:hypothetical protein GQ457_12G028030 [Hibiscus cannabinus]
MANTGGTSNSSSQDLLKSGKILLTNRSHHLEKLLLGTLIPSPETVQNDAGETVSNDDYEVSHLLPQFVDTETTTNVWSTVIQFFANRSTTNVIMLHCKLRSIRKGGESMRSYLMQIKEICDTLSVCGSSVSVVKQIATILNGLPIEYQPFVAVITTSKPSFTLDVKSTLVDAVSQLKGFNAQMHLPYKRPWPVGTPKLVVWQEGHSVDRCWHRFDQSFSGVLAQDHENRDDAYAHMSSPTARYAETKIEAHFATIAKLVAKGYSQVPTQDFQETLCPVVKASTINVFLSLATANRWQLRHIDFNNAFLNVDLANEVFMEQPPSFEETNIDGVKLILESNLSIDTQGEYRYPRPGTDILRLGTDTLEQRSATVICND